jgi:hypothetical protein
MDDSFGITVDDVQQPGDDEGEGEGPQSDDSDESLADSKDAAGDGVEESITEVDVGVDVDNAVDEDDANCHRERNSDRVFSGSTETETNINRQESITVSRPVSAERPVSGSVSEPRPASSGPRPPSADKSAKYSVGAFVEIIDNDRLYPAVITTVLENTPGIVGVKYFEFEGDDQQTHISRLRKMPSGPYNSKNARAKLSIGSSVLCKYPEDGEYYNAIVTEFTNYGCMVYFTDYGDTQEMPLQYLAPRPTTPRAPVSSSFTADESNAAQASSNNNDEAGDIIPCATDPAVSSVELVVDTSRPSSVAYEQFNDDFMSSPPTSGSRKSTNRTSSYKEVNSTGRSDVVLKSPKKKKVSFYSGAGGNTFVEDAEGAVDGSPSPILSGSKKGDSVRSSSASWDELEPVSCDDHISEHSGKLPTVVREHLGRQISFEIEQIETPRTSPGDNDEDEYFSIHQEKYSQAVARPLSNEEDASATRKNPTAFQLLKKSLSFRHKKSKFKHWTREEMILLLVFEGIQIRSEETVPTIMLRDECDKRYKHAKKMPTKPVPLQGTGFVHVIAA